MTIRTDDPHHWQSGDALHREYLNRYSDGMIDQITGANGIEVTRLGRNVTISKKPEGIPQTPIPYVITALFEQLSTTRWIYKARIGRWNSQPAFQKIVIENPLSNEVLAYNTYENNNTATTVGPGIVLNGKTIKRIPDGHTGMMQRVSVHRGTGLPVYVFHEVNEFVCPP